MNVALIPARAGSKRLPGKNKRIMCGLPLWQWSYYCAVATGLFQHIWVSTDDEDIIEQARALPSALVHRRPPAPDDQTTDEMIEEWDASCYGDVSRPKWTRLVLLQPTSPVRMPIDANRAAGRLDAADSAFSAWPEEGGYQCDGSVYAVTREAWERTKRLITGKISVFHSAGVVNVDIDTQADWDAAERYLSTNRPLWARPLPCERCGK